MKSMKIGEVAARSGIGIETIRYYEREGLLLQPERRPSGYRQYDEATVERLDYIKRAKDLGFTLAEIKGLLDLSFSHSCCDQVRQTAEAKIAAIEAKIRDLQRMKKSLGAIINGCRAGDAPHACPLLHRPGEQSAGS
jgi:Hg(II)-responsive transcriptional regulator